MKKHLTGTHEGTHKGLLAGVPLFKGSFQMKGLL